MKSNPFYALSASAMLLGCWLLSQALHLQAGQLRGLLALMFVLQVYEGLLVGLGSFLVRTGRATRDGVTVLVLESVFLMDAPLLAAECVTASAGVGTRVALALAVLAAAKLAWVRRATPALLSGAAAALLAAQAACVLALPVAAALLASARLFGPVALYGFWWATLPLPLVRRALREQTGRLGEASRPRAIWTWAPAALTLLHLWAVGYIHTIDFRPAFLAPFLLGLALTAQREQLVRQVALPGIALVVSLGQDSLAAHPFGPGAAVSPLQLALTCVAAVWGYLAWRDRARWLWVLALGSAVAGSLGAWAPRLADALDRTLRRFAYLLPPDGFEWGVLTVLAAFVFLAAGARRSLFGGGPRPAGGNPAAPPRTGSRERAAVALALAVLAFTGAGSVLQGLPLGDPRQSTLAGLALLAAASAVVTALRAHGRAACLEHDTAGRRLAGLALAVGALCLLFAFATFAAVGLAPPSRPPV